MKKTISFFVSVCFAVAAQAQNVISVPAGGGDMTQELQKAIEKAKSYKGKSVTIELQNSDYNMYRSSSSAVLYHVSNTTSEKENPDPTKHIGLWMKGLENVTIDGNGARLVTHGEMTSFVIDQCKNIKLKDFTITAADPTVTEMTVVEVGDKHLTARIHPQSRYEIKDGKFSFVGHSWKLADGIAQAYDPEKDITWRSWSPLSGMRGAIGLGDGLVCFTYGERPQAKPGFVFQMRDGYRDEVCGLIQYSKDVTLENLRLAFLGNFGIVGQVSENITYRGLVFEPEPGSGRTCAGFADFVQMSGCKGKITIENSRFVGSQDDPINIHGTHLAVREFLSPCKLALRYMHHQTFGFQSFFKGDKVEIIDSHSLLPLASFTVEKAEMKSDREIVLTLNKPVPDGIRDNPDIVVENTTYTPEVVVRNNFFSRVPSRGLLVTTRKKVLIEGNTFFRTQMNGILIADDARSWFESGMVRDVAIRNNRFVECGAPVIYIMPENIGNKGYVHRNISITGNRFDLTDKAQKAVYAKSVDGLSVTGNTFSCKDSTDAAALVDTHECKNVVIEKNITNKSDK